MYKTEFLAGEDGGAAWAARLACNYITAAVEDCSALLLAHGCNSQDSVEGRKAEQLAGVLASLNIAGWDSDRCPVVRWVWLLPVSL